MAGLEEESPYDKLEAKEVYLPSSDSSIPTSPMTPSTPSLGRDTPTFCTPIESTVSDMEVTKDEEMSPVRETKTKSKKRKKFWPFRKHKATDKRKPRSQSVAASAVLVATSPKSRAHSEGLVLDESAMRNRRSYTLLTDHITAKYAALHARQRVAAETRTQAILPRTVVERFDRETPSSMSLDMFKRSLYCEQLKFKLRSALQNIATPLSLNKECDTRGLLLLLVQQSLQLCRWQRENTELSLLTELLTMIQPLPNQL